MHQTANGFRTTLSNPVDTISVKLCRAKRSCRLWPCYSTLSGYRMFRCHRILPEYIEPSHWSTAVGTRSGLPFMVVIKIEMKQKALCSPPQQSCMRFVLCNRGKVDRGRIDYYFTKVLPLTLNVSVILSLSQRQWWYPQYAELSFHDTNVVVTEWHTAYCHNDKLPYRNRFSVEE